MSSWVPSLSAGGDNRDRTDDPLLARQVLSQLSYTPIGSGHYKNVVKVRSLLLTHLSGVERA